MAELEITIPTDLWLSANGRYHWATRARRTRRLRQIAYWQARRQHVPHHAGPVDVTAQVQARGRFDPPNAAPTVKAIIDGLTDAGCWDDDDSVHAPRTTFERMPGTPPKGTHTVRIIIKETR